MNVDLHIDMIDGIIVVVLSAYIGLEPSVNFCLLDSEQISILPVNRLNPQLCRLIPIQCYAFIHYRHL